MSIDKECKWYIVLFLNGLAVLVTKFDVTEDIAHDV
jgi:hypothetical protein